MHGLVGKVAVKEVGLAPDISQDNSTFVESTPNFEVIHITGPNVVDLESVSIADVRAALLSNPETYLNGYLGRNG